MVAFLFLFVLGCVLLCCGAWFSLLSTVISGSRILIFFVFGWLSGESGHMFDADSFRFLYMISCSIFFLGIIGGVFSGSVSVFFL